MITSFVVGGVLALLALAFVLLPMVRGAQPSVVRVGVTVHTEDVGEDAISALREVEFDRATGKLSDADFATLSARYRPQALAQLERESRRDTGAAPSARDPEAMIAQWRDARAACPTCGPRPEAGAVWCSTCGHYLPHACPRCRQAVTEEGASYCSACGVVLAAA